MCQGNQIANATLIVNIQEINDKLKDSLGEFGTLPTKMATKDIRDRADTANTMNVKQAELNMLKTRLEVAKISFDMQKKC